jgi:predicted DNA-binding WGR domain protein
MGTFHSFQIDCMAIKRRSTGRYESSTDFWSAEIIDKSVTIHFGKIGRGGTRAAREFSSFAEAEYFVSERLKSKLEEGFKLVESEST